VAAEYTWGVSETLYIETFGCQMNAHDSEKVIGTLEQQGYAGVQDEAEAGLICITPARSGACQGAGGRGDSRGVVARGSD